MRLANFSTSRLLALAAFLVFPSASFAQSFNIDIGATPGTNPAGAYGAGADQPGFWSWAQAIPGAVQVLSTLTGAVSPVTLTIGPGGNGNFAFDNPLTLGNDGMLMDDGQDLGGIHVDYFNASGSE